MVVVDCICSGYRLGDSLHYCIDDCDNFGEHKMKLLPAPKEPNIFDNNNIYVPAGHKQVIKDYQEWVKNHG